MYLFFSWHFLHFRARQDLLTKYPTIVDHSSNSSMSSLIANNDYSILTVWDVKGSPLNTMLNRPAPSLYSSSFDIPNDEPLTKKDDGSHTWFISKGGYDNIRFYRLALELIWNIMEQQSGQVRELLGPFKNLLVEMNFISPASLGVEPSSTTSQSSSSSQSPPSATDVLSSFDDLHWRLCFLTFELSACIFETVVLTGSYMDSIGSGTPDEERDRADQHGLRWANLQRQCGIITFLVDSMTKDLSTRFYLPPPGSAASASEDTRKVVYGLKDIEDEPINPSALRDVAVFAQFGLLWLNISTQVWATVVPSKKTFKKLTKKRLDADDETRALEPILAVRLAIATVIKSMRTAITTITSNTKKLATRMQPTNGKAASTSASSSSSLATSTFLEHQPTILALQSPDHSTILQSVLQHIDQSHAQTGANLTQLLNSLDAPLQQMKL